VGVRGHIDFSTPNPDVLDFCFRRFAATTPRFSISRSTCRSANGLPPCVIAAGHRSARAEDMALSAEDAAYVVDQFGIDIGRPLLTQVSAFDPWKTHSA